MHQTVVSMLITSHIRINTLILTVHQLKSAYALIVLIGNHITYTEYFANNKFGELGCKIVQCPIGKTDTHDDYNVCMYKCHLY